MQKFLRIIFIFFVKWLYMFRTINSSSSGATFNKLYSAIGTFVPGFVTPEFLIFVTYNIKKGDLLSEVILSKTCRKCDSGEACRSHAREKLKK